MSLTNEQRELWEETLQRWQGLSARQWGEDSDEGHPYGPKVRCIDEVCDALDHGRRPRIKEIWGGVVP